MNIAYRTMDSPVGTLLLAATERGLVRIAFAREGFDAVLEDLAGSWKLVDDPGRLDAAHTQLEEYFAGRRKTFDLPLDLGPASGFRHEVQRYLPRIDYGHTQTYKHVAEQLGNPKAVRAVGTACATNPVPIVVPCHRVLRTDGRVGEYLGGSEAKSTLLRLEGAI